MGFIGWIVLGLIAGAIAKAIMPGRQGGGWIGSALFNVGINEFWSISTWLLAIGGALIVLVIWGFVTKNRSNA
jgi:uncharacterized membrane protein YeaQ/YmgE (transglycosylase-associated protein family)